MKKLILSILILISLVAQSQEKDHAGLYRFDSLYSSLAQKGIDTTAFKIVVQRVSDGKLFKMYWPTSSGATNSVETLNVQYTDAANSGTSETDLMSYTLPAGQLTNDGDRIEILGSFNYAANANTKTLRFKFGAYTSTWGSSEVTSSGGPVKFTATIIRTSATTQKIVWEFSPQFGTHSTVNSTGSETLSGAVTLKFTGESNTASNDITQKTMTVTYYPYTP